jgi:hypothetical protein
MCIVLLIGAIWTSRQVGTPTKIQMSFHDKLMIAKTHKGNTPTKVIESSLLIGANHTNNL